METQVVKSMAGRGYYVVLIDGRNVGSVWRQREGGGWSAEFHTWAHTRIINLRTRREAVRYLQIKAS
jgi:hypothetical protein